MHSKTIFPLILLAATLSQPIAIAQPAFQQGNGAPNTTDLALDNFNFNVGGFDINGAVNILDRLIRNNFNLSIRDGLDILTEALGLFGIVDSSRARAVLAGGVPQAPARTTPRTGPDGEIIVPSTSLEQVQRSADGEAPLLPEISPEAIAFNQRRIDALLTQIPRSILKTILSEEGQEVLLEQATAFNESVTQTAQGVQSVASFAEQSAASHQFTNVLAQESEALAGQSQTASSSRDILRNLSSQLRAQAYAQSALAEQNLLSTQSDFAASQQAAQAAQQREQLSFQLRSLQVLSAAQGEQLSNLLNVQMAANNRQIERELAQRKADTQNDFFIPGLAVQ